MIEYQNRKIEQSHAPNKPKYVSHNGIFAIQANLPLRTKHNRYNENNERLDRVAVNKIEYSNNRKDIFGKLLNPNFDKKVLIPNEYTWIIWNTSKVEYPTPLPKPTPLSKYENINNGLFRKSNQPIIHKPKRTIRNLVSVADCDLYKIFDAL